MNSKIEKLENSTVKLSFSIPPEKVEEGMQFSYNKNKASINIHGFRKGKAPRALIEKTYGPEVFLDDAISHIFPDAYEAAIKEHDLDPVARPELDVRDYSKEQGLDLEVIITVKPEVKLGEYKGLTYKDEEVTVSDEEVDALIEKDREKNARLITVTDRAVQEGDTAIIDFEGFVDGVAFEGGKGENYELVIGSKTFIDTFEEQIIGKNIGEEFDVNVTFPEEYQKEDLQGKPAVFKVKVNEITAKELPALDDDFAGDVSDFDSFAEYKQDKKDKLINQKEQAKERQIEEQLIKAAVENAELDVPKVMIENQMNMMLQEFANRVTQQGLDFDRFLQYSGQSVDVFRESYRETADSNVKARLVLEAIAKQESIEITEEDVNNEISRISQIYGLEEDKMKGILQEDELKGLKTDLKTQKALKIMVDSAKSE